MVLSSNISWFTCSITRTVLISAGQTVAKYLTDSKITEMTSKFVDLSKYVQLEEALDLLIQDLRTTLRGITPAHKMLLATLIFSLLFVSFMIFFLMIRDLEYDIWGQENHWWLMEFLIRMVTGLYIIKGMVLGIIFLSHKVHYFGAIICFVLGVLCFILYVFSDDIFPKFVENVRY
ncbi:hypothetical protein CHS0354_032813 [Potamilus streckersoni]|uniref:Uncharacterized protein n=1 Tax=Potamilus streckersoni TaxID=2493646 RepID=A0AAE0VRR6_9BIVA|nr:hypothetical protein CHS0354_032813 [Potamilus streckersoni]